MGEARLDEVAIGRALWIDRLRGAAILAVVLYHAAIAMDVAELPVPGPVAKLNLVLTPVRIPALVFVSGLLLPRSLAKPTRVYLLGKLRRIAWPYVLWTALTAATLGIGSRLAGDGDWSFDQVVDTLEDPKTYTWYLGYLLVFYLLVLIVPVRIRPLLIPLLLVGSAVAADGNGWSRFCFLFAFFLLGELVARDRNIWRLVLVSNWLLALAGVGSVAALTALLAGAKLRYAPVGAIGVAAMIVVAVRFFQWTASRRRRTPLDEVGRDSVVYYLTHWLVVTLGIHVLDRVGLRSSWVVFTALVVAALFASWSMAMLQRRYAWIAWLYAWPNPAARTAARSTSFEASLRSP